MIRTGGLWVGGEVDGLLRIYNRQRLANGEPTPNVKLQEKGTIKI